MFRIRRVHCGLIVLVVLALIVLYTIFIHVPRPGFY